MLSYDTSTLVPAVGDRLVDVRGVEFIRAYHVDGSGVLVFADYKLDGTPYTPEGIIRFRADHQTHPRAEVTIWPLKRGENVNTGGTGSNIYFDSTAFRNDLGCTTVYANRRDLRVPPGEYELELYIGAETSANSARTNIVVNFTYDGAWNKDWHTPMYIRGNGYDGHNHAGFLLRKHLTRRMAFDLGVRTKADAGSATVVTPTNANTLQSYVKLMRVG